MSDSGFRAPRETVPVADLVRDSLCGPSPEVRERMRADILAEVRRGIVGGRVSVPFGRAAAVFCALTLALGGTSLAAARSLPGSPLYPLKRAIEEVRVQLSPSSARGDALVEVARERVREVRLLLQSDAPTEAVDTAIEGFENATERALQGEPDPMRALERTREIEQAIEAEPEPVKERVQQGAQEPHSSPSSGAPQEDPDGSGPSQESHPTRTDGSDPGSSPGPQEDGSGDGGGADGSEYQGSDGGSGQRSP